MPKYLDTRGRSRLSIGICGRCNKKVAYDDLMPDPNFPGLLVCEKDRDVLDPWRITASRPVEVITLPNARPDVSIAVGIPDPNPF